MKKKGGHGKKERKKEDCGWWDEVRDVCTIDNLPCSLDEGMEDCESYETLEEILKRLEKNPEAKEKGSGKVR